jgi:predicted alpha/beta-hydrolase family hydrolase
MRIFLAHGASGNAASMQPFLDGLAARGLEGATVALPVKRAEDAVPAYRTQLPDDLSDCVIGGHSYGGRVASLIAADERPAGLVLLSYPLHRPGRPEQLRTEHWPRISCPVLLVSGESDQFARIELLRREVVLLVRAQLVTYVGVRHGVGGRRLDETVDHVSKFVGRL